MYDIMTYKDQAKLLNNLTYTDYYYRLMLLSRSVFEWEGLPPGMDERWIEKFLSNEGECVFFKHREIGYMVSKIAKAGRLNEYDEPTRIEPVFNSSKTIKKYSLKNGIDAIVIKNNDEAVPTMPTLNLYAMRLTDIQRTIDVNVNAQKTPFVIVCTDKQKKSMQIVYDQISGNKPAIYGDKSLEMDKINVLKTDAPIVFDKLQIQKHAVWNEAMTFLGINNANMDKRERLVDDEVQANNEQIKLSGDTMLKARQLACKQINELFGLSISVKRRNAQNVNTAVLEGGEKNV